MFRKKYRELPNKKIFQKVIYNKDKHQDIKIRKNIKYALNKVTKI